MPPSCGGSQASRVIAQVQEWGGVGRGAVASLTPEDWRSACELGDLGRIFPAFPIFSPHGPDKHTLSRYHTRMRVEPDWRRFGSLTSTVISRQLHAVSPPTLFWPSLVGHEPPSKKGPFRERLVHYSRLTTRVRFVIMPRRCRVTARRPDPVFWRGYSWEEL